jgi:hypothetical protein
MLTTTQLNTGYSAALVYRQMIGRLRTLCLHRDRSPPFTDRFLRGRPDSHYFVLRERPFGGSVPVTSLVCRPACTFESSSRAPRVSSAPVAGGPLTPCVPRSGVCSRCSPSRRWRGDLTPACAVQPLENSKASTSIFVLQATKSQRRMPWRLKPKKDVGDCEKPREAVYQATIRGYPNGATQHLS